ncbi:zinc finger protein 39-like isoform X4 [Prionailurus iriomotensis]
MLDSLAISQEQLKMTNLHLSAKHHLLYLTASLTSLRCTSLQHSPEDVAVHFTSEDWQVLDVVQKKLYWVVMLETYSNLSNNGH